MLILGSLAATVLLCCGGGALMTKVFGGGKPADKAGVEGRLVESEADGGNGLPGFHLGGLPDATLQEARDRVRAAVVNCGMDWPKERIVVGLSPATLRKTGSGFDLVETNPLRSYP